MRQGRLKYATAEDGDDPSSSSMWQQHNSVLPEPQPEIVGARFKEPGITSFGLSVDQVGINPASFKAEPDAYRGNLSPAPEATPEESQQRDQVDTGAADSGKRSARSYFDLEIAEKPLHLDLSADERSRTKQTFQSGATYDGEWLNGMREGIGRQHWPDGTEYVGEWLRGRANGRGQLSHSDGDVYTGDWINGRAHGFGVYKYRNGEASYCGEFKNDLRDGMGEEKWQEGSVYAGEFRKGMKFGFGENTWPDDSAHYSGRWCRNELKGPGRFIVGDGPPDGPIYEGHWDQSAPSGMGRYRFMDSSVYEGKYLMDRKHGFGVMKDTHGEKVHGFWEQGDLRRKLPAKE